MVVVLVVGGKGRGGGETIAAGAARRGFPEPHPASLSDALERSVKSGRILCVGRPVHAADMLREEVFAVEIVVAAARCFFIAFARVGS